MVYGKRPLQGDSSIICCPLFFWLNGGFSLDGDVINYRAIRERIGRKHVFESEMVKLIDSEVIPPTCLKNFYLRKAAKGSLIRALLGHRGPNAASLLQIEKAVCYYTFFVKEKPEG